MTAETATRIGRNELDRQAHPALSPAELARPLCDMLRQLDSQARRERRSTPVKTERRRIRAEFWHLMEELTYLDASNVHLRDSLHSALHPWLMRGRLWHRSYYKPHGYAGDYRMVEWMYDLEHDGCDDATRNVVENMVDDLFRSVHSVHGVWHRRVVFAQIGLELLTRKKGQLRILDVACGGSRYLHDLAAQILDPSLLNVTLLDQDPAALAFAGPRLAAAGCTVTTICDRVRSLASAIKSAPPFDYVISTGLFDYLPDQDASALLGSMLNATAPDGQVVICNFSPGDRSRVVKDWVVDWPLIYRTADQLGEIWPTERSVTWHSPDGGLAYASLDRPRGPSLSSNRRRP